jgi:hypothetical protein
MKYVHHQVTYVIDDEWLREAGALGFSANRACYPASVSPEFEGEVIQVPIASVEPLIERAQQRGVFCENEKSGESARQRVVRILRWFVSDAAVEPVIVEEVSGGPYQYRLVAGCHRFHCANAMGFVSVPAFLN